MAVATRSLAEQVGRFAPSITGSAHPGTLLAALLCWLDIRHLGGGFLLRLEDLDHTRLREGQRERMVEALSWLGLDWDQLVLQSDLSAQHERALDQLADQGLLYPCSCSRKGRQAHGRRSPDGGFAYDNRCRGTAMPVGGWRVSQVPVRLQLPDRDLQLSDESGLDLSQNPAQAMGDPIVRRRDGVLAYHLVVVVDDAASAVTRVVRGRDLATSTATQVAIQELLSVPTPRYRHHMLLLESEGKKLAKLHKSLPYEELRRCQTSSQLCGRLAQLCGLRDGPQPCTPQELLADFSWSRVRDSDCLFTEA